MLGAPENSHYLEEQRIDMNKKILTDLLLAGICFLIVDALAIWVMMGPVN